jgi:uncharacterized membrane protein YkvA (DUF1232 family)
MGSLNELIARGRLVWRLMNDARVATWIKIGIPVVVVLYFIMPIDLIPDFIPVLGQLDDLGVVLLGMSLMIRFSPQYVVDEHRVALGYETSGTPGSTGNGTGPGQATRKMPVDGEYTVVGSQEKK